MSDLIKALELMRDMAVCSECERQWETAELRPILPDTAAALTEERIPVGWCPECGMRCFPLTNKTIVVVEVENGCAWRVAMSTKWVNVFVVYNNEGTMTERGKINRAIGEAIATKHLHSIMLK